MKLTLKATQDCVLSLGTGKDRKGNPAPIDETVPPTWFSTNTDIGTVTASEDGKTATLSAVGPLGTFQVNANVDLDTTEGTKPGVAVLDVEVIAGDAVIIDIVPGTPTEQP